MAGSAFCIPAVQSPEMSIATGLAGLKTATELLRGLRETLKADEVKPDEIAGRVGEIYDYIVDSKDALINAKDEIANLSDELRALQARQDLKDRLRYDGQVWWLKEGSTEMAVCPVCYGDKHKILPLTNVGRKQWINNEGMLLLQCRNHERAISFYLK